MTHIVPCRFVVAYAKPAFYVFLCAYLAVLMLVLLFVWLFLELGCACLKKEMDPMWLFDCGSRHVDEWQLNLKHNSVYYTDNVVPFGDSPCRYNEYKDQRYG